METLEEPQHTLRPQWRYESLTCTLFDSAGCCSWWMAVSRSRPLPSSNRNFFSSDLLGSFNYRWSTTLITLWALLEETPRHRVSVKYSTWGVWQPGRQAGQPGSDWNRIVNVMPAMWHENGGENKCITFNGVWEERPRDCQNGRRISSQVLTQRQTETLNHGIWWWVLRAFILDNMRLKFRSLADYFRDEQSCHRSTHIIGYRKHRGFALRNLTALLSSDVYGL